MAPRRQRPSEATTASPPPASKRLKTTKTTHVPAKTGFDFLVNEDARKGKKLEAKLTNGVPSAKTTRVDESHAVVAPDTKDRRASPQVGSSPDDAIGISSGEDSDDSTEDEAEERREVAKGKHLQNGHLSNHEVVRDDSSEQAVAGAEDVHMAEREIEQNLEEDEPEEPSFGDMLQARHPDPIDVQASLPNPVADRQALVPVAGERAIAAPSGISLGTVLTQALKTNDKDLLESCFSTRDLPSIRATIQRLQSQHVATLLQRLAERIHKRPGRTDSLLVWVQWSLIAHGGYLASQPEVMRKLKSLSQVVRERANGLQPLLHLKGKLDMLSAQLELRRNVQLASRLANADDEDDEEGVVYIEGQDDDWSDSEADGEHAAIEGEIVDKPRSISSKSKQQIATPDTDLSDSEDDSGSDDDDIPNGVLQEGDDISSEDEDEEGLFDMEADETSDDEGDDLEEDSDEAGDSDAESEENEDLSGEESDDSGVKAPQLKTLNRKR